MHEKNINRGKRGKLRRVWSIDNSINKKKPVWSVNLNIGVDYW